MINPAIIFESAVEDPKDNRTPTKTETPLNICESEPGNNGKIRTKVNAYKRNLIILKVGGAQSG